MNQKKKPRVSVVIVTFHSAKYLSAVFSSLEKQTIFDELEIIVVDNNSNEETLSILEKRTDIVLVKNNHNAGFTGGNNQGIEQASGEFVFCLNHDVILEPDFIERCLKVFEDKKVAAVSGKILKWDFDNNKKTEEIDTLGLEVFKNHKVVDADSLDAARKIGDSLYEVFGASAAVVLYRKSFIDTLISQDGYFFDPDYQAYKEDVDVAFRLRHLGLRVVIDTSAVAYHDRWETGSGAKNYVSVVKGRQKKSSIIQGWSYTNHLRTILKNEFFFNLFLFAPWIVVYELGKFVYLLFFEPKTLKGGVDFLRDLTLTLKKRRAIFSESEAKSGDFRSWYR